MYTWNWKRNATEYSTEIRIAENVSCMRRQIHANPTESSILKKRTRKQEEEEEEMLHNENRIFLRTLFSSSLFLSGGLRWFSPLYVLSVSLRLAIALDAYYYSVCKVNYNVDVTFQERKWLILFSFSLFVFSFSCVLCESFSRCSLIFVWFGFCCFSSIFSLFGSNIFFFIPLHFICLRRFLFKVALQINCNLNIYSEIGMRCGLQKKIITCKCGRLPKGGENEREREKKEE